MLIMVCYWQEFICDCGDNTAHGTATNSSVDSCACSSCLYHGDGIFIVFSALLLYVVISIMFHMIVSILCHRRILYLLSTSMCVYV